MKCFCFFVILCILCFLFSFQCHLAFWITCFYFQRLVRNSDENSLHGSWKRSARHFLLSPQDLNSNFPLTLILFLPSIQPLPQSFSWKRIEAVTLVINNIQKRPTLTQVPIISVECTVLKHRSQLGWLLTCQKWDEMIVQCIQRKFRTNLEGD